MLLQPILREVLPGPEKEHDAQAASNVLTGRPYGFTRENGLSQVSVCVCVCACVFHIFRKKEMK